MSWLFLANAYSFATLGTTKKVQREDMIVAVTAKGHLDDLVQVADFHTPPGSRRGLVSDPRKGAILIEPALCSPICIIEVVEQLVPTN